MTPKTISQISTTDEPEWITAAVVEAVAEAEDVSPVEITQPLASVIDPDALDALFASTASERPRSGQVEFEYHGYHITVRCLTDHFLIDLDERSSDSDRQGRA